MNSDLQLVKEFTKSKLYINKETGKYYYKTIYGHTLDRLDILTVDELKNNINKIYVKCECNIDDSDKIYFNPNVFICMECGRLYTPRGNVLIEFIKLEEINFIKLNHRYNLSNVKYDKHNFIIDNTVKIHGIQN